MIKKKTLLTLAAALTVSVAAHADGLRELERFLREVNSGSADFTQVTTAPPNRADANVNANAGEGEAATAARNAKTRTSSGKFEFLRPGRFRFDYTKPFAQTIVADGQTLWLHDPDLNQVTARKQQDALGNTPVALVASGTGLKGLQSAFDLRALPDQDGLAWLEALPLDKEGQLQRVRVGFRSGQLAVLEIADSLGQTSVLTFGQWQTGGLSPTRFRFTPPAGADVIRP